MYFISVGANVLCDALLVEHCYLPKKPANHIRIARRMACARNNKYGWENGSQPAMVVTTVVSCHTLKSLEPVVVQANFVVALNRINSADLSIDSPETIKV